MNRYRSAPNMPSGSRPPAGPPPRAPTPTGSDSSYNAPPGAPPRRKSYSKLPPQNRFHNADIPVVESLEGSFASDQAVRMSGPPPPPPPVPTRRASVAAMQRGMDDDSAAAAPSQQRNSLAHFTFPTDDSTARTAAASSSNNFGRKQSHSAAGGSHGPIPAAPLHQPATQVVNPLRNPHSKVSGVELHAPLPRLQATTERAADRTRDVVYTFMEKLCPERAAAVQNVMEQFSGREALLMEAITSIFGDEWATHQREQRGLMAIEALVEEQRLQLPVSLRHTPQPVKTTYEHLAADVSGPALWQQHASLPHSTSSAYGGRTGTRASDPVGINNSRPSTPSMSTYGTPQVHNRHDNPLPPFAPQPGGNRSPLSHQTGGSSVYRSAEPPVSLQDSPHPVVTTTEQWAVANLAAHDVSNLLAADPVSAVMAAPSGGGILTPPLPPELAYQPYALTPIPIRR